MCVSCFGLSIDRHAARIGHSLLDLAIGWLAAQPWVSSVIAGVTRPEQVAQNVRAASWKPDPEQLTAIGALAPIA